MSSPPAASFLVTATLIALWCVNVVLTNLCRMLLFTDAVHRHAIFLSLCHMVACAFLGYLLSVTKLTPAKPIRSRQQFLKITFLATIFCGTIVLGNASLKYLPVSFNQAIGASTPFFTAVFSYGLQGLKESFWTYLALIPVAGGVVISSGGEPLFHLMGFIFCLSATAGRALKSVLQAILMADPSEKMDPMSLLYYMASVSIPLMVPLVVLWEPNAPQEAIALARATPSFGWWLFANSLMAYAANLLNFYVTKYTSALTLQVVGNAKGVVAAGVSVLIFKNPVTVKGMTGYAVTVLGVVLYSEAKKRTKKGSKPTEEGTPKDMADRSLGQRLLETVSSSGAQPRAPAP